MQMSHFARWAVPAASLGVSVALMSCGETPQADRPVPEISAAVPRAEFSDCENCPAMIVVPPGTFMMGTPPGERFRGAEPLHEVVISEPFAVGKFEITFDEWEACVAEGACDQT